MEGRMSNVSDEKEKCKVVHISEIDEEELFLIRKFLIADEKGGKYIVVTEDNVPLARYKFKTEAEKHANHLNRCLEVPSSSWFEKYLNGEDL